MGRFNHGHNMNQRAGTFLASVLLCVGAGVAGAGGAAWPVHQQPGGDEPPEKPNHWNCWEELREDLSDCTDFCPEQSGNWVADSNLEVCREETSTTGMAGCLNDLTTDPPDDCNAVFQAMLDQCADDRLTEKLITCTGDYDTDPGAQDACQNLATEFLAWCEGEAKSAEWSGSTIEKLTGIRIGTRRELWIKSTNPDIDRFELAVYRLGPVPEDASRRIPLGRTSVVGRFSGLDAHAADVDLSGSPLRVGERVLFVAKAYAGESGRGILTFQTEMGFHRDDLNRDGRVDVLDLLEALRDPEIGEQRLERITRRVTEGR